MVPPSKPVGSVKYSWTMMGCYGLGSSMGEFSCTAKVREILYYPTGWEIFTTMGKVSGGTASAGNHVKRKSFLVKLDHLRSCTCTCTSHLFLLFALLSFIKVLRSASFSRGNFLQLYFKKLKHKRVGEIHFSSLGIELWALPKSLERCFYALGRA
jgi:hypothetical protein